MRKILFLSALTTLRSDTDSSSIKVTVACTQHSRHVGTDPGHAEGESVEEATNRSSWFYECARCLFFDYPICSTVLEDASRESGSKTHGDATRKCAGNALSAASIFVWSRYFSHDE